VRVEPYGEILYFSAVNGIFVFAFLTFAVVGCSSHPNPMEGTRRSVDTAVYDVGTGIKKTGSKIQQAAFGAR
jgi:hypothetical protein